MFAFWNHNYMKIGGTRLSLGETCGIDVALKMLDWLILSLKWGVCMKNRLYTMNNGQRYNNHLLSISTLCLSFWIVPRTLNDKCFIACIHWATILEYSQKQNMVEDFNRYFKYIWVLSYWVMHSQWIHETHSLEELGPDYFVRWS